MLLDRSYALPIFRANLFDPLYLTSLFMTESIGQFLYYIIKIILSLIYAVVTFYICLFYHSYFHKPYKKRGI